MCGAALDCAFDCALIKNKITFLRSTAQKFIILLLAESVRFALCSAVCLQCTLQTVCCEAQLVPRVNLRASAERPNLSVALVPHLSSGRILLRRNTRSQVINRPH